MKTRTLLILAAITALIILAAFAVVFSEYASQLN